MGQVVIKAWGSMSPNDDGSERVVEVDHAQQSEAEVWSEAHRAIDELARELAEKQARTSALRGGHFRCPSCGTESDLSGLMTGESAADVEARAEERSVGPHVWEDGGRTEERA